MLEQTATVATLRADVGADNAVDDPAPVGSRIASSVLTGRDQEAGPSRAGDCLPPPAVAARAVRKVVSFRTALDEADGSAPGTRTSGRRDARGCGREEIEAAAQEALGALLPFDTLVATSAAGIKELPAKPRAPEPAAAASPDSHV